MRRLDAHGRPLNKAEKAYASAGYATQAGENGPCTVTLHAGVPPGARRTPMPVMGARRRSDSGTGLHCCKGLLFAESLVRV